MKKIAVFCGASNGREQSYRDNAFLLGKNLAEHNLGLVYGGASVGVMGALADGSLKSKGQVWGVIPESIVQMEVAHNDLTELIIVDSMHERKKKMYDLADAFFVLPGGMGTLDEMCEIITWAQLGFHQKPCYLINENDFFKHLWLHFKSAGDEGFISKEHLELVRMVDSAEMALKDFLKMDNP